MKPTHLFTMLNEIGDAYTHLTHLREEALSACNHFERERNEARGLAERYRDCYLMQLNEDGWVPSKLGDDTLPWEEE